MSIFPKSKISENYLDLRQTAKVFWIKIAVALFVVAAIVWFKNNILGYFAQAAGMERFVQILQGPIYFWISFGFLAVVGIYLYLQLRATRYQIYKDRVEITTGVLQQSTLTVKMDRLPQLELTRSVLGRILNYGTVFFQYGPVTSIADVMVRVENIDNPKQVMAFLHKLFDTVISDGEEHELSELK